MISFSILKLDSFLSLFRQRWIRADALQKMLNLNEEPNALAGLPKSNDDEPVWKLLIYDSNGQDIISPLLNVKELRECGVTLHLRLHSDRDAIPDVPAIYFVSPTDENVQRICSDLRSRLYDRFYLNFITAVSREKLEQLAAAALQGNCAGSVKKVYDQYVDFISLEQDMFVLKEHQSHNISYYGECIRLTVLLWLFLIAPLSTRANLSFRPISYSQRRRDRK